MIGRKRNLKIFLIFIVLFLLAVRYANAVFIYFEDPRPSQSTGPIFNGSLTHGKRLPLNGENFKACSWFLAALGRNSVHDKVRSSTLDAYEELVKIIPGTVFVYGETGWPDGGSFWPHKTHQNGLSVDYMVPVKDANGQQVAISCHLFNRWGYATEFDNKGKTKNYSIDFEAVAAHLFILDRQAHKHGMKIIRVIFDVDYHSLLFNAKYGGQLKKKMEFPVWKPLVRHDEHYHVDFAEIP